MKRRSVSLGLAGSRGNTVASTALRERGFAEAKRLCYSGLGVPTLLREVVGRLTVGSSVPGLPGRPHDLDVVLLGERPPDLHGLLYGVARARESFR